MRACPSAVIITWYWSDRKHSDVLRLAGQTLWPLSLTSICPLRSFWTDGSLIPSYADEAQSSCRSSSSSAAATSGFFLRFYYLLRGRSSPTETDGPSRRPPPINSESWRAKLSGHLCTLGSRRYFCHRVGLAKELWRGAELYWWQRTEEDTSNFPDVRLQVSDLFLFTWLSLTLTSLTWLPGYEINKMWIILLVMMCTNSVNHFLSIQLTDVRFVFLLT